MRLAIVSTGVRRDLLAPLKHFTEFEIIHFYRHAEYGDLTADDLDTTLHSYQSPLNLYRQLVHARPDVIQGVEPFSLALQPYLWTCYLAVQRTGARLLVVTLENRPLAIKFNPTLAWFLRRGLHVYLNRACLIIVLNEGARRNVLSCGIAPERIQKLMWGTWGVDVEEFSPATQKKAHSPTILFAGRLHPEKGIFVLLNAFEQVRVVIPNARLIIVGDGPAREEVEVYAATMPSVELHGVVKNRAMPEFFRAADVVAMPSLTTRKWEEQVGMVAIQAMACGVPVVATRSGAIPEYVPDGVAGLLVPEDDAPALAAALIRMLQDPSLCQQLGNNARAFVCEHYDAAKNVALAERTVKGHCGAGRV